jgi:CHAD domain-containing protein
MAYCCAVVTTKKGQLDPAVLSIRLLALLEKIPDPAGREDVHRLRTTVRRLEVQLGGEIPEKVSKSLKALRKNAGKVRDIDVHLGLLKTPLLTTASSRRDAEPETRKKLSKILKSERDRQVGLLRDVLAEASPRLRAKLPALAEHAAHGPVTEQEAHRRSLQARDRFLQWTRRIPDDSEHLHQLRIHSKKLRYSLEPLEEHRECAELAEKLKQVQDAIGSWHDWATLEEFAARELDSADAKVVTGAMRARAGREHRKALRVAQSLRTWMTGGKPVSSVAGANISHRIMGKAG